MEQFDARTPLQVLTKGQETSSIEIPVFVSGASSSHFTEALQMLDNLNKVVRPVYPTSKLYFFDLGLRTSEASQVCYTIQLPGGILLNAFTPIQYSVNFTAIKMY